jgi:hypothetical protein
MIEAHAALQDSLVMAKPVLALTAPDSARRSSS